MFHNGSKYFSGEAMQKSSVVFETMSPGIDSVSPSMRDIPVSTMTYLLLQLDKKGRFIAHDVEDPKVIGDNHYRDLLLSYKEKRHYAFKIEDDNGWIGVLTCAYVVSDADNNVSEADNNIPILSNACIEYIDVQCGRLATLLKLSNKKYAVS